MTRERNSLEVLSFWSEHHSEYAPLEQVTALNQRGPIVMTADFKGCLHLLGRDKNLKTNKKLCLDALNSLVDVFQQGLVLWNLILVLVGVDVCQSGHIVFKVLLTDRLLQDKRQKREVLWPLMIIEECDGNFHASILCDIFLTYVIWCTIRT